MIFEHLIPRTQKTTKLIEADLENFRFYFEIYENIRFFNCEKPSLYPSIGKKQSLNILDTVFGEEKVKESVEKETYLDFP